MSIKKKKLSFLKEIKTRAQKQFLKLNFPTRKEEAWRFTNLSKFKELKFSPVPRPHFSKKDLKLSTSHLNIQLRDTFLVNNLKKLKLPSGLIITNLSTLAKKDPKRLKKYFTKIFPAHHNYFLTQNTAQFKNGLYIYVPPKLKVKTPLEINWLNLKNNNQKITFPRLFIHCAPHSEITCQEHFSSKNAKPSLTNSVTEILMEKNSSLNYLLLQNETLANYHFSSLNVEQKAHSKFSAHTLSYGGKLVRNDIRVNLNGQRASCYLRGLFLLKTKQQGANYTLIKHNKPKTSSQEHYNGLITDKAQGVFDGQIAVSKNAPQTKAEQINRNILLTDTAQINSNPRLEINNADIICKHGSSIGQLDELGIFYLRSRGFSIKEAQTLLLKGFADEILNTLPSKINKDYIYQLLNNWLLSIKL